MKEIKEITIAELGFKPVSMMLGKLMPAVWKKENGTYGIRIKTGEGWSGQNINESWDYFVLDETGLIITSPRGYASEFNKKVRIIDIDEAVELYKDKFVS